MYQLDEYYLMHKNDKIARFSMTEFGTDINIIEIYKRHLMPYGTRVSERLLNKKFTEWKNSRRIPDGRPYVMQIYKKARKSIAEMESYNMGLCMTDCYWYQPTNENRRWEDINFQNNGFSEEIGKMLINANTDTPSVLRSPDITLNGECPKMWAHFDGTTYLVKGCRMYAETKTEICNEVFASLLAEKIGVSTVQYYMMRSGESMDFCCAESFIKTDALEFVSFKQIANEDDYYGANGVLKFIEEHGMQSWFDRLLVIDFLIGNYNRTFNDIGILVDSETLQFLVPAPIFDYEESMDINLKEENLIGMFGESLAEQMKYVSDYSWLDIDAVMECVDEIDRVYSLGGFRSAEINKIKAYFRNRVNLLKKMVPPETFKKSRPIEYVPKQKEQKKEPEIHINVYPADEQNNNEEEN